MNSSGGKTGTLREIAGSLASRRSQNELTVYEIFKAKRLNQRRLAGPSAAKD